MRARGTRARRAGPTFRLPIRETSTGRSQGNSNSNSTATWEQPLHWLRARNRLRRAACRTHLNSSSLFSLSPGNKFLFVYAQAKRAPATAKLQCELRTAAATVASRSHATQNKHENEPWGKRKQAHKPKVRVARLGSVTVFSLVRYYFYHFFAPTSFRENMIDPIVSLDIDNFECIFMRTTRMMCNK